MNKAGQHPAQQKAQPKKPPQQNPGKAQAGDRRLPQGNPLGKRAEDKTPRSTKDQLKDDLDPSKDPMQRIREARERGESGAAQAATEGAVKAAQAATGGMSGTEQATRVAATAIRKGAKVQKRVAAGALAMAVFAFMALVGGFGQGVDFDAQYQTADGAFDTEDLMTREQLRAYQAAAREYNTGPGGALPWSIIAAIAQLATEHGKVSPYDGDNCDRAPERELLRSKEISGDGCEVSPSVFPVVSPSIGATDDDGGGDPGLGPFLIARYALTGDHEDVDPHRVEMDGSGDDPRSATAFIAYEMDRIRTQLVEEEDWEVPGVGDTDAADLFWAEVVSRLPIIDPRATECATPTLPQGADPSLVRSSVAAVWQCELLRADLHTYIPKHNAANADDFGGRFERLHHGDAATTIVREAVAVAQAFSGTSSPPPSACGVVTLPGSIGQMTRVVVLGDSLTVGSRAELERRFSDAGVALVVDGLESRRIDQGAELVEGFSLKASELLVVALGTNDAQAPGERIDALMAKVPDGVKVMWLTVEVPGSADTDTNNAIKAAANRHSGRLTVLDWAAWADRGHFVADGVHLTPEGYAARAGFIADAVLGPSAGTVSEVPAAEPAGVFPLTQEVFAAYSPNSSASRCDAGANIHAAARAFVAGESVSFEASSAPAGRIGDRSEQLGPFAPMVGGWFAMPWALGTAERDALYVDGPRRGFEPSEACRSAVGAWVDAVAAAATDELHDYAGGDLGGLREQLVDARPGQVSSSCDERTDGSLESFASSSAFAKYLAVSADTTQDPTAGDDGTPDEVYGDSATTTTTEAPATTTSTVPRAPEVVALERALLGAHTAFRQLAAEAPDEVVAPVSPGSHSVIGRLSPSGRMMTDLPAVETANSAYVDNILRLAVAFGGIVEDDPRFDPGVDLVELIRELLASGSFAPGAGGTIAGLPPVAVDAFNKAVAWSEVQWAGTCGLDLPVIAAIARIESGAYWMEGPSSRLQADGSASPPVLGYRSVGRDTDKGEIDGDPSADWAVGFTQFIPSTWKGFASRYDLDGNGDGVVSPQNFYDGARATAAYLCERYTSPPGWWTRDQSVAPSWGNDLFLRRVAMSYNAGDGGNFSSSGVAGYGQLMVDYEREFRAAYTAGGPGGGFVSDGTLEGTAIAYAMAQVGKPYCRDDMQPRCSIQPFSGIPKQHPRLGTRAGPDVYDCSGLVSAAYLAAGLDLKAYTTRTQLPTLPSVPLTDLRPGDLVFYGSGGSVSHVALYTGNGQIVHAANHAKGVRTDAVGYWSSGLLGAARPSMMAR